MTSAPTLVADIGGTKLRIALASGPEPSEPLVLRCADFSSIEDALFHAVDLFGTRVKTACIGVAGPVMGDDISITNNNWSFSVDDLKRRLDLDRLMVVNDFAALASALPLLDKEDLHPISEGHHRPALPQLIIGPGTGLGVAVVLFGDTDASFVLSGEGGYVSLPVLDEREIAAWQVLNRKFGRVSAERVLCGSGLVELHNALREVDGLKPDDAVSSYQIVSGGVDNSKPRERETLELFLALLGDVAGNAALTCGARGGVFLNGELLNGMGSLIAGSNLHARLEEKGRGRPFLADVGTFLITDRFAPLKGCARLLGTEWRSVPTRSTIHAT